MKADPRVYLEAAKIIHREFVEGEEGFCCNVLKYKLTATLEHDLFSDYFNPHNGCPAWLSYEESGEPLLDWDLSDVANHRIIALLLMAEIAKDLNQGQA